MKNVNGLANAMRLVESACEKGEITIIGEGGVPTPVELYNKCIVFINKNYGVDILNLVAQTAMEKGNPCECNCSCHCSCHTEIVDEDENEGVVDIDTEKVRNYLDKALIELMPYADEDYIDEVIDEIIYDLEIAIEDEELVNANSENVADIVLNNLYDKFSGISYDLIKAVATTVGEYIVRNCMVK